MLKQVENDAGALKQKQLKNPEAYNSTQQTYTQPQQSQTYTQTQPEQQAQSYTQSQPKQQAQSYTQSQPKQQAQTNENNAYKVNDLDDLGSIFKDLADKINGGSKPQQNSAPQPQTQQDGDKLSKEQIDFEKEIIKTNDTFIKEAKSFLKTLILNDPQYEEKIETFLSEHNIEAARGIEDIKEALHDAQVNVRHSKQNIGHAYIHKAGENEMLDNFHEMDSSANVNPQKTFKSTKGVETTYQNFNSQNNTAIINFNPPINEVDQEESKCAVAYNNKTGEKCYIGDVQTSKVNGVCVKVSQNGIINFNLPENKEILSHPEVLSKIIEQYPESFKTLPPVVYASDPKLFAESFKKGTIDKAKSNAIGKQNIEDYYFNANFELSQMNDRALNPSINKSKAQEEALKKVDSQIQIESQMGES